MRKHPALSTSAQLIHGGYRPAAVRAGERIRCVIRRSRDGGRGRVHDMWRMSPFGVEVRVRPDHALQPQELVDIDIQIGSQHTHVRGTVVATELHEGNVALAGIRLDTATDSRRGAPANEQRSQARWRCHELYYPTGWAKNAARFNDKLHFRVDNISAGGMRMITSMRNKHLIVGLPLRATVQLPSVGAVKMHLRVEHVAVRHEGDKHEQVVGVSFVRAKQATLHLLAQYVLQFGGDASLRPTPRLLEDNGFVVQAVADALEFDLVRTDEDYREVLELRCQAYRAINPVEKSVDEMGDVFDARARIIIVRFRGRIVATLRICFHGAADPFELESLMALPPDFPPRHLVVECSRAAVHPDFRGTDIFLNLMRYTALLTIQSNRRWIVQSTYEGLVPIYQRMGFQAVGGLHEYPPQPGLLLQMLSVDLQKLLTGTFRNPFIYNAFMPSIEDLLEVNDYIHLSWAARKRVALLRMLTPLYHWVEQRHIASRKTKAKPAGGAKAAAVHSQRR